MRFVPILTLFLSVLLVAHGNTGEPADTRLYWVYEGGWFSKEKDVTWYELNEETFRRQGSPSRFREVKRTKDYVELYDDGRKVSVRLADAVLEVRWDSDGKDAEWKLLYKGRWKKRAP